MLPGRQLRDEASPSARRCRRGGAAATPAPGPRGSGRSSRRPGSVARRRDRCVSRSPPRPPCSSGNGNARMSWAASSWRRSSGNSPVLSISAARGATRSSARVRTASRRSTCSSVSRYVGGGESVTVGIVAGLWWRIGRLLQSICPSSTYQLVCERHRSRAVRVRTPWCARAPASADGLDRPAARSVDFVVRDRRTLRLREPSPWTAGRTNLWSTSPGRGARVRLPIGPRPPVPWSGWARARPRA